MTLVRTLALGAGSLAVGMLGIAAAAQERQRTAPEIFDETCIHCHDSGGWGTRRLAPRVPVGEAALLRRKDLPTALTRLAVRRGVGSMPPLTPTDITDEELERLARWLDEAN